MRKLFSLPILFSTVFMLSGCGVAWQMDYGSPAAQFLQEDVGEKGKPYIGQLIEVRGTVTRIDVTDRKSARVYLGAGINCNFEGFAGMAQESPVGTEVYVHGFLKRCEKGSILIEPAVYWTPGEARPFHPK
jgi:hypothetical protein